jgi:hypothetical protein
MAATGLGFAGLSSFWPLLLVAFVGTLNPSAGDVSVFLPLEHARLAQAGRGRGRAPASSPATAMVGALCAAFRRLGRPGCRTWLAEARQVEPTGQPCAAMFVALRCRCRPG